MMSGVPGWNTSSRRRPPTSRPATVICAASSPTGGTGRRTSRRPIRATDRPLDRRGRRRRLRRARGGDPRPFKGPRAYDATGLPLHFDNRVGVQGAPSISTRVIPPLHDEITTYPSRADAALERRQDPSGATRIDYPNWSRWRAPRPPQQVVIGKDTCSMLSADGLLMPAKRDQAPPGMESFQATAESERAVIARAQLTKQSRQRTAASGLLFAEPVIGPATSGPDPLARNDEAFTMIGRSGL